MSADDDRKYEMFGPLLTPKKGELSSGAVLRPDEDESLDLQSAPLEGDRAIAAAIYALAREVRRCRWAIAEIAHQGGSAADALRGIERVLPEAGRGS